MALLDIAITLLLDPELSDLFEVLRRVENVNEQGLSEQTLTTFKGMRGVFGPTGDNSLTRTEAFERGNRAIQVITNFSLRTASKSRGVSYQPDVVIWKGDYYLVREIENYSQYGAGFISAACVSVDLINQAEMTTLISKSIVVQKAAPTF